MPAAGSTVEVSWTGKVSGMITFLPITRVDGTAHFRPRPGTGRVPEQDARTALRSDVVCGPGGCTSPAWEDQPPVHHAESPDGLRPHPACRRDRHWRGPDLWRMGVARHDDPADSGRRAAALAAGAAHPVRHRGSDAGL